MLKKLFLSLSLILTFSFLTGSLIQAEPTAQELLVGIWYNDSDPYVHTGIAFYPDGRVALGVYEGDARGTYQIDGQKISFRLRFCYASCVSYEETVGFQVSRTTLVIDGGLTAGTYSRIGNITYQNQHLCPGAPENIVSPGFLGQVTFTDGTSTRLRADHSLSALITTNMPEGTWFYVLDGPVCSEGVSWWHVETKDTHIEGWVAEGVLDTYYIELVAHPFTDYSPVSFEPYYPELSPEATNAPPIQAPTAETIQKCETKLEQAWYKLTGYCEFVPDAEARDIDANPLQLYQCTWYIATQTKWKDNLEWLPDSNAHAKLWDEYGRIGGLSVDNSPKIGDIVVLEPGCYGANKDFGHVAYVEEVNGNTVRISEYNGAVSNQYSERNLDANSCAMSFIHWPENQETTSTPTDIQIPTNPWWCSILGWTGWFNQCK